MKKIQAAATMESSISCNLCNNNEVSVLSNRNKNNTELRTVICKHCGLVWSDPFPFNPRQFYENDYRIKYKNTYLPKSKHIFRAGNTALSRRQKIKSLLTTPQKVLDVGSGGGEFAYLLKSLGHELYGIEPNKYYAEFSAAEYDLNLTTGFIQDAPFSNDSFSLITLWHVLEHTEDPFSVLLKLCGLLKANGVLVVEVPNIEAVCQSPKNTFHEAHLFNFNLETLTKLGEKAGLRVDDKFFSDDFGNITIFFKHADPDTLKSEDWTISNNAERITTLVNSHTNCKHFLSITPYKRFLNRICRTLFEAFSVSGQIGNKSLLDRLYKVSCLLPKPDLD